MQKVKHTKFVNGVRFLHLWDLVQISLTQNNEQHTIAIWIQEDGCALSSGLKIATNCFTFEDVEFLCQLFRTKYSILASPNKDRDQWIIYIPKKSMPILANLIKNYVVPSMFYKFNNYLPIVTNK